MVRCSDWQKTVLIAVIARDLGDISLVGIILSFSYLPTIFLLTVGLVCCLAIGLNIIGSNVVLTHCRASFSWFLPSLTRLFFFSPSFSGGL